VTKRLYLLLFLLGILVLIPIAYFQSTPGYMDADYYFAGALRLVEGAGFTELVLWNYLDDPAGLPHPSHAYWMPTASLLAFLGMVVFQGNSFNSATIGYLLIAGLIPPLTAALAYTITNRRENAIYSGVLAALPVYYLAYLSTTDTFAIYMVLGALWFLLVGTITKYSSEIDTNIIVYGLIFVLGVISGLMHLTRADGVLWLAFGLLYIILLRQKNESKFRSFRNFLIAFAFLVLGYLLIMGPWMGRNLSAFGTPLSPGGLNILWLNDYDELFSYPASILTFQRWWDSGLEKILHIRIHASGQNLQTALAVQGGIILAPLIILGMWHYKGDMRIKLGFVAWLITFLVMTVVFAEVGWRGGFFHSGAALQPLFWALAPVGLDSFVNWGARVRGWNVEQARIVFRTGVIGLLIILTVFIAWGRVIGSSTYDPVWEKDANKVLMIESVLSSLGATPENVVMVNNAPGYYAKNVRPAISIPNGDEQTALAVARRYGAHYLLLEENHPQGLDDLYELPNDLPGLDFLLTIENTHIFRIEPK
jgi:hypothetical protein